MRRKMETRPILFIGGPLNGQRLSIYPGQWSIEAAEPGQATDPVGPGPTAPLPPTVTYTRRRLRGDWSVFEFFAPRDMAFDDALRIVFNGECNEV